MYVTARRKKEIIWFQIVWKPRVIILVGIVILQVLIPTSDIKWKQN